MRRIGSADFRLILHTRERRDPSDLLVVFEGEADAADGCGGQETK